MRVPYSSRALVKVAASWAVLVLLGAACKSLPEPIMVGKTFEYQLRSDNNFWVTLGERFPDGHKQGQWRQFDVYGRLLSVETYENDSLQGPAIYFHYENEGLPVKEQGFLLRGNKFGVWEICTGKGNVDELGCSRWQRSAKVIYDEKGHLVSQLILFPDGKVASEHTFDSDGSPIYFRQFNRCGRVIAEGKEPPTILE